ncbi:MAG: MnhB domain-containing protein [Desulfuromonadales bacterium]|nr:MnhB domain-containing protein [Desulfuromonadales bacterium]
MTTRPLIAEVLVRWLYPLLLLASVIVLLRGHNQPGGGFIGGLLAVVASSALALVFTTGRAERLLPLDPVRLTACGVLLALGSGLPALAAHVPFLTHLWADLPFGLPLSTVLLFDLGVYLAVWGALGGFCLALIRSREETS